MCDVGALVAGSWVSSVRGCVLARVVEDFSCCLLGALVVGGVLGCVLDEVVDDVLCSCTQGVIFTAG